MRTQNRTISGWIKRRARALMRAFGTPRAKAVRYASEDWKAFKGTSSGRSCDELGVCNNRPGCSGCGNKAPHFAPGVIEFHRRESKAMKGFRRFMDRCTGGKA